MHSVRVRAPGKVNLHLAVGPLRADGYHELVTVFHAVDVTDVLTAAEADELSLTIEGAGADQLPTDERNLAWRAAHLLARQAGVAPRARLTLTKSIPVAAGMAGGSADAAAALVACARLWGIDADLPALAAQLGADVAFPLLGGTAIGTGRGEFLSPLPAVAQLDWVFAVAEGEISASSAYAELRRLRGIGSAPPPLGAPDELIRALRNEDLPAIAAALDNDLAAAVLTVRPDLQHTLDAGRRAGALASLVSGSGPTCAFLCADPTAAKSVAHQLREAGVCQEAVVACGPAPGAVVID